MIRRTFLAALGALTARLSAPAFVTTKDGVVAEYYLSPGRHRDAIAFTEFESGRIDARFFGKPMDSRRDGDWLVFFGHANGSVGELKLRRIGRADIRIGPCSVFSPVL